MAKGDIETYRGAGDCHATCPDPLVGGKRAPAPTTRADRRGSRLLELLAHISAAKVLRIRLSA